MGTVLLLYTLLLLITLFTSISPEVLLGPNVSTEYYVLDPSDANCTTDANKTSSPDVPKAFEWTALGDSYASGVGTSKYIAGSRCLRYDHAYPQLLNLNTEWNPTGMKAFPPDRRKMNFVACSGAETRDVIEWQLLEKPKFGKPDLSFGNRPPLGNPEIATLSAGGDDVDFPGILSNCILNINIVGGPPKRTCQGQRDRTWSLLKSRSYAGGLKATINAIMERGRGGPAGHDFRLYVTGYGKFFNGDTTTPDTNCDGTTFASKGFTFDRSALGPNRPKNMYLTRELRREFNEMTDSLNRGVEEAVTDFDDDHIQFVDIETSLNGDDLLAGHRFCEKGIQEPDLSNSALWFWHFPYNCNPPEIDQTTLSFLDNVTQNASTDASNVGSQDMNLVYPNQNDFLNAFYTNLVANLASNNSNAFGAFDKLWSYIGWGARVFHPKLEFHLSAMNTVLTRYIVHDTKDAPSPDSASSSLSSTPTTSS